MGTMVTVGICVIIGVILGYAVGRLIEYWGQK